MKEVKYFNFSCGSFSDYYLQFLGGFSTEIQKGNGNSNPSKTFQEFENKEKLIYSNYLPCLSSK